MRACKPGGVGIVTDCKPGGVAAWHCDDLQAWRRGGLSLRQLASLAAWWLVIVTACKPGGIDGLAS